MNIHNHQHYEQKRSKVRLEICETLFVCVFMFERYFVVLFGVMVVVFGVFMLFFGLVCVSGVYSGRVEKRV